MLKTTNILALVGGGKKPKYPLNKIIIWDDNKIKVIGELRFNSNVLNVKIKMDKIIGVTEKKIYIFNLNTLNTIDMFDTFENNSGIVSLSSGDLISVLAFPFEKKGSVKLVNLNSLKQPPLVDAHESGIACLSININGTLLATASDKGTLIRVFHVTTSKLITELRRGSKNAEINCIVFDEHNKFVGCASDNGTIHIFSIVSAVKNFDENYYSETIEEEPKNQKSFLGKIGGFFKINNEYMEQERSFARFRIPDEYSLFAFGNDNTINVITMDGKYYKAAYDRKNGGDFHKIEEKNFLVDIIYNIIIITFNNLFFLL